MSEKASNLSDKAREVSRLASLWLEHPYMAYATHEAAASAHESEGNPKAAAEHRKAASYWAKKELQENNKRYVQPKN